MYLFLFFFVLRARNGSVRVLAPSGLICTGQDKMTPQECLWRAGKIYSARMAEMVKILLSLYWLDKFATIKYMRRDNGRWTV